MSVVLFFLFFEFFLRIFDFNFDLSKYIMKFNNNFQVDEQLTNGNFLKDPILFWRFARDNKANINYSGIRDKRDPIPDKAGNFRIICLGGSVTYGAPDNLIKLDDTYAKRLESILNSRHPLNKYEVINAGVSGYTSYQGFKYLQTRIINYHPDLILIHFGHNDGTNALYLEDNEQVCPGLLLTNIQNILIKSKTYQLLSKLIFILKHNFKQSSVLSCRETKFRVSGKDYKQNLELMAKLGEQNGFKAVFIPPLLYEGGFVFYAHAYKIPDNLMAVDYLRRFEKEKDKDSLFYDNCHFTNKGHQILAEEIADFLIKNNLLNAKK